MNDIIIDTPAIAADNDNNKYRFVLSKNEDVLKSIVTVESYSQRFKEWRRVPSGWYVETLIDSEKYYIDNNEFADMIYLDMGTEWYVKGLLKALKEIKSILGL